MTEFSGVVYPNEPHVIFALDEPLEDYEVPFVHYAEDGTRTVIGTAKISGKGPGLYADVTLYPKED